MCGTEIRQPLIALAGTATAVVIGLWSRSTLARRLELPAAERRVRHGI